MNSQVDERFRLAFGLATHDLHCLRLALTWSSFTTDLVTRRKSTQVDGKSLYMCETYILFDLRELAIRLATLRKSVQKF